ncbi:MAG: TlpA family protein disulfide reductase [candidate division Zixibacteria bacterium]|nr:TlpA family protein disulfide reductase [Candidatus Tariuqbacter arcticus]
MNNKIAYIIQFILLFHITLSCAYSDEFEAPGIGGSAPTFSLMTVDGERVYLRDYCGNIRHNWQNKEKFPVVLSFFSTTCRPCQVEIKHLHRLAEKYQGTVKFFLIAVGEPIDKVQTYVEERQYTIPVLLDQYLVVSELYGNPQAVPKLVLMDSEGVVRLFKVGYEAETINRLDALLNKAVSSGGGND